METVTFLIAAAGSVAVMMLRLPLALAAYVAVLSWYPDYLRVPLGTIDLSAGRIVGAVLLLRCLLNENQRRKFVWSALDTWVTVTIGAIVGVYCLTGGLTGESIENRGGLITDTWFAYIAARLVITDRETLIRFIKAVAIVLIPLALYGMVEATTGWQPLFQLVRYRQWRVLDADAYIATETRWGFTRAIGPFSHPILFGNFFVMFLPVVWALRRLQDKWGKRAWLLAGIVFLGAVSSMSSGTWGSLLIVCCCLLIERYKKWTWHILAAVIVFCVFAAMGSNRPFHHVALSYINLGKGDWYQRARLIDAAIDTFWQWWLAGYGGKDPGWGSREGGYFWGHFTDMNNQFLLYGVEGGILAMVGLAGVIVTSFRGFYLSNKQTNDVVLKTIYWSMGCSLIGILAAWQGVSFFGQVVSLFYAFLGIIGSAIFMAKKYASPQKRQLRQAGNNDYVLVYDSRQPYMK